MNTRQLYLAIIMLLAVSPPLLAVAGSYTHTLKFNPEDLRIGEVEMEGNNYAEITLKGLINAGEPGDPSLPWISYSVSVPPDATDLRVTVSGSGTQLIPLENLPVPEQYDIPLSVERVSPSFTPLSGKYRSGNSVYPTNQAYVEGTSAIGGFNRIVTVMVTPLVWSSSNNMLAMQEDLAVTLTWRTDSESGRQLLYPGHNEVIEEAVSQTRKMVVNPESVGTYAETVSNLGTRRRAVSSQERIPYVIVTTKELSSSLERLAALRRLRGFKSKIVCIEDILVDPKFKDGDLISGINDDAGKLRAFLRDAYTNWGTEYVLLAGKYPKIPGRFAKYGSGSSVTYYISNHYFSNLTDNWNNQDSLYAKYDNQITDYTSTICVGRLNCSTDQQVKYYVDKLIKYEFLPSGIDPTYLNNACVIVCEDSKDKNNNYAKRYNPLNFYNNYLRRSYVDNFVKLNEAYADSLYPYLGRNAVQDLNTDKYGFVDFIGHGHYGGVATYWGTYNYPVCGITALDSDKAGHYDETGNGLDNWNNRGYPSWSVSMSCDLGDLGTDCKTLTFPESFLFGGEYGGVAFICNAGAGYFKSSSLLSNSIFQSVIEGYKSGTDIPYVGDMEKIGKSNFIKNNNNVLYEVISRLYTTGDPLTMLWGKAPKSSRLIEDIYQVEGLIVSDTIFQTNISLYSGTVNINKVRMGKLPKVQNTDNVVSVYYRSDVKPFILPLRLQDYKVSEDFYTIVGNLSIVNESGNTVGISINNGANGTIESISDIDVAASIHTSNNSKLILKSLHSMSFSDTSIVSGSNIDCECDGVILLDHGLTIPLGVNIAFN